MSVLCQRLHRLNENGTYDILHLETDSRFVLRPNNGNVEQALVQLENSLSRMITVSTEKPATLAPGHITVVGNDVYVGSADSVPLLISVMNDETEI